MESEKKKAEKKVRRKVSNDQSPFPRAKRSPQFKKNHIKKWSCEERQYGLLKKKGYYVAMTRFLIPLGVDSSLRCFELYLRAEIRLDVLDCSCWLIVFSNWIVFSEFFTYTSKLALCVYIHI